MGTSKRSRPLRRSPLICSQLAMLASVAAMLAQTASAQTTTAPGSASTFSTSFIPSDFSSTKSDPAASAATDGFFTHPTSDDNAPGAFADGGDDGDNGDGIDDRHSGLVNYYFVFLALFIIIAFLGVYIFQKRRRARKEAYRNSGQNALARDMDGWTNRRRWMNGHWRSDSRTENDGLNELGQAPPAYTAKAQIPVSSAEVDVTVNEPQIPLRTLARNEGDRSVTKPPEYSEVARADSTASSRADASRPAVLSPAGASSSQGDSARP